MRGQAVMFDRDLAALYGVTTGALNRAVERNAGRFPPDFVFRLTAVETRDWISQIVISNPGVRMGVRRLPRVFTEQGVAMLSGVLKSPRAVRVNVEIMRAFVRMRREAAGSRKLGERLRRVEAAVGEHDAALRDLYAEIERIAENPGGPTRKIGFSGEG